MVIISNRLEIFRSQNTKDSIYFLRNLGNNFIIFSYKVLNIQIFQSGNSETLTGII